MVRDLFPVRDIPKVFSLLMLVVGLSPLAPTVGIRYSSLWLAYGFLNFDVYWNCNSICSPIGLPNSYVPDSSISLKPKPILLNFATVLKEPQFYTYAFTGSIAFSGLFTYVAASPSYLWTSSRSTLKHTVGFLFMSISFIMASQLNSVLLKWFRAKKK
jgi:DHA1 family bicyclomycin/chloramphenicol resistance-like MFS transporter